MPFAGSAKDTPFAEISEGLELHEEYTITQEVYASFLDTFADQSPIHVDEPYARASGFEGRVMHGAILNGFLSHFVGMQFPGRRALLLSCDLRYLKPNYLGDRVELRVEVAQKVESQKVLVLNVAFQNITRDRVTARGRVQVGVRDE